MVKLMDNVTFCFAHLHELEDVMLFISRHWNEKHIYANSRELLEKDFLWLDKPDTLTIALAKNCEGEILGVFCFKFFNYNAIPDLTGSLWKVTEDAERRYQMIGLRLRQFVIKNVEHRFFSAPGPGPQTKVIYKMLRLQWNEMKQYYAVNPLISDYQLVELSAPDIKVPETSDSLRIALKKVEDVDDLSFFRFDNCSDVVPYKDRKYIENRFFNYPFYDYDVLLVFKPGEKMAHNIVVCRKAIAKDACGNDIASAYRIVDYYGSEDLLPEIISALFEKVKYQGDEFLDFVCHGFDDSLLKDAGMTSLDFDSTDVVIPNWFEPLFRKNVSVNCVADVTPFKCRQCKADGDQDRPSLTGVA